ncbi:hypothetical protein N1851_006383 [Merluccius polli]|uniref:Gag-pol polyprotein n=1 Tax=Merluccius polli TaxID=89951 RepID=A0AA47N5J4_MERPO|nr:hypothetical protein N1851_006383 [Merluccius polli]
MSVTEETGKSTGERDISEEPPVLEGKSVGAQLVFGSRERQLTEKGQQVREEQAKRHVKAFLKSYDSWKSIAKECRKSLKQFCSQEDLDQVYQYIQRGYDHVHQNYEPLQRNSTNTSDVVQKMDACNTLTAEICDIVSKRLEVGVARDTFEPEVEKQRVRMSLNRDEHKSIFGETNTETVISDGLEGLENVSIANSKASSKRAEAEAELAAKQEQAKSMEEIQAQQSKLTKLESEWNLHESQVMAEMRQKQTEVQLKLEEEKSRLKKMQVDMDVKVAAARVRTYEKFEGGVENEARERHELAPLKATTVMNSNRPLSAGATMLQSQTASHSETARLAEAIASSLSLNRLPVPEPAVFSGDPLKFVDFKMSFLTLIGRKPIPAREKMLYLKNYLIGEARKAVEGFFYRSSEDAYEGAWAVLEDRYGNPFVVQKAFRDKLMKWPKINSYDSSALREFADFLKSCVEAMPQVKGLAILNDCEENHKLLKKLPDWIVRKWSRIAVDELDKSGEYPAFNRFTEFVSKEARIACNPIASPLFLNSRTPDEKPSKRAKALSTSAQSKDHTSKVSENVSFPRPRVPCLICKEESHGIAKCPGFAAKPMGDKKTFIHQNHLCFGCLRKGHITKDCRTKHICGVCGRRHPTCLHDDERGRKSGEVTMKSSSTEGQVTQIHKVNSHAVIREASATSSIVPVYLSSVNEPEKEILTYALLDTQSDSTFVLEDLARELNVATQPLHQSVVGLQVRSFHNDNHILLRQAYTRDFIPVDKSCVPTPSTALQWSHLKHLAQELPSLQDCDVGLLIGYDCPSALAPLEVITGHENEPFAQKTELGWSIIGAANPHLDRQGSRRFVHRVAVKEIAMPTAADILRVLESDFSERNSECKLVSQDDVRFIQLLSETIRQRPDGHLEMPLPFKGQSPPLLPNNRKLATIRLQHLKRKLKANQQFHDHYKAFMADVISNGDAEPVPETAVEEVCWFIPHHGIYHPKKPGKLRVVFDCSAKFHGISLNDTLLTGPDLINSLVGVLCRFRREAVAIICDIEKMFHQFLVTPENRSYLRFLWWEHGDLEHEPKEYQMAVHLFGAASSPGCANFGLKYLAQQYESDYPSAAAFVANSFYVDDGLLSVPSIKEASELILEAQQLCKKGGLRLHKFNSNEREVLSCVDPSERASGVQCLDLNQDSTSVEHALGLQWSVESDHFSFNVNMKDKPDTRRGILSVVASLYDPLGFVAPFVLSGKCILQELCRRNVQWDDPLSDDLRPRWEEWKTGLEGLKEVSISRCYYPPHFGNIVSVELHHFSDASSVGYGACSYLRYKNDHNKVHCSLVKAVQVFTSSTSKCTDMLDRLSRFSSWTTLLKVVARIKRLASKQKCLTDIVTVKERENAAKILISLVQKQSFSTEIKILEIGNSLPSSGPLFRLDPILSEGILRVGGRLKHAPLSEEFRHPIILPNKGHITQLILSHYHSQIFHQGRSQTQMELRANGFWILGCSTLVSKFIYKCVQCRKLRRSVEEQRMAELPKERVEESAPFTNCGMDCFGPFIIKRNRKEHKRYGLILTCLYSRAVHIEMVEDLSTDSFINALRCFISLRGAVRQLHCDQGRNFVGAKNELKEALKQCDNQALENFLADKQCEFVLNAPSASHAGGVWERQIRTIRNVLNYTLAQSVGRLDDASLRTLFYEAMAIVNSRPLSTDIINDPNSLEPLTPNHLILMKSKLALPPPGKFVKEDVYGTKRWRRIQYLIEQFWSRWKGEYLSNISMRQKWHVPRRNVQVNDVVIIKEDILPRNQWQLGRVVETTVDSDGLVRRVKVQVGTQKSHKTNSPSKPSIIERPIQKLVLLLESE